MAAAVIHVPHFVKTKRLESENIIKAFWKKVKSDLDALPQHLLDKLIVFIDSNGRVGQISSQFIGSFRPDEEDLSGSEMHQLCVQHGLCIPQTFSSLASGHESHTLQKGEPLIRCDFILVPAIWLPKISSAYPIHSFPSLHVNLDHVPVLVNLVGNLAMKFPWIRRRKPYAITKLSNNVIAI